jgi:hypothetical protein
MGWERDRTSSASKKLLVGSRFNEVDGDFAEFGDYANICGLEELEVLLMLVVEHQQHLPPFPRVSIECEGAISGSSQDFVQFLYVVFLRHFIF